MLLQDSSAFTDLLDESQMPWEIKSFKPFQPSGPDAIKQGQLQQAVKVSCNWLAPIHANCVILGYIPEAWRLRSFRRLV